MPKAKTSASQSDGSNLDFEIQLWAAADKMRGHMDASEYKHVALGLIFLKYISVSLIQRMNGSSKKNRNAKRRLKIAMSI